MVRLKYFFIYMVGFLAMVLSSYAQQGGFANQEMNHIERRIYYYQKVINSDIPTEQIRRANAVYDAYLTAERTKNNNDRAYADKLHEDFVKDFGFTPQFDPFYTST